MNRINPPTMQETGPYGLTGWGGLGLCRKWLWKRRRRAAKDWMSRMLRIQTRSARRKSLVRKALGWVKRGYRP